eukprot:GHVL01017417.1.p1 GENE.GHVL01017417.1~~GHVL01017417.1.p1  ORF type:complete len:442 (+),score=61.19 GHVL01017417.1:97-1326(+)
MREEERFANGYRKEYKPKTLKITKLNKTTTFEDVHALIQTRREKELDDLPLTTAYDSIVPACMAVWGLMADETEAHPKIVQYETIKNILEKLTRDMNNMFIKASSALNMSLFSEPDVSDEETRKSLKGYVTYAHFKKSKISNKGRVYTDEMKQHDTDYVRRVANKVLKKLGKSTLYEDVDETVEPETVAETRKELVDLEERIKCAAMEPLYQKWTNKIAKAILELQEIYSVLIIEFIDQQNLIEIRHAKAFIRCYQMFLMKVMRFPRAIEPHYTSFLETFRQLTDDYLILNVEENIKPIEGYEELIELLIQLGGCFKTLQRLIMEDNKKLALAIIFKIFKTIKPWAETISDITAHFKFGAKLESFAVLHLGEFLEIDIVKHELTEYLEAEEMLLRRIHFYDGLIFPKPQ